MNVRLSKPQTLAGALGDLLRIFGARASDADLAARWDEIMGPEISAIAKLAAVKKMRDGKFNVAVRPANPAFALQLSYMQSDVIARLNKYFGRAAVGKVTFRK